MTNNPRLFLSPTGFRQVSAADVLGISSFTGTGSVGVLQTSPTLITPVLGAATGTSLVLSGACSAQTFSTDAGTIKWGLLGYTATAPSATGYIEVIINATTYKLLAST